MSAKYLSRLHYSILLAIRKCLILQEFSINSNTNTGCIVDRYKVELKKNGGNIT